MQTAPHASKPKATLAAKGSKVEKATNILAERLARLLSNGLIERYPSNENAGREPYRLTEKGHSLRGIMVQVKAWGLDHIAGKDAQIPTRGAQQER